MFGTLGITYGVGVILLVKFALWLLCKKEVNNKNGRSSY